MDKNIYPLETKEMDELKSYIRLVIPRSRTIKLMITRIFEIIGIPLHIWNDLSIYRVGSCIGEVLKIHN